MKTTAIAAAALIAFAMSARAQETFTPDEAGFIRNWLVLAPLAMAGQSGADEINYDFIGGEAKARPKARESFQ
jgi:hypothetical protein